jgi:hypothetical protein
MMFAEYVCNKLGQYKVYSHVMEVETCDEVAYCDMRELYADTSSLLVGRKVTTGV